MSLPGPIGPIGPEPVRKVHTAPGLMMVWMMAFRLGAPYQLTMPIQGSFVLIKMPSPRPSIMIHREVFMNSI
jgi:hypothetical protein